MFKLEILFTTGINQDIQKSLIEQVPYLSADIDRAEIRSNSIILFLKDTLTDSNKIESDFQLLFKKTLASFDRVEPHIFSEHYSAHDYSGDAYSELCTLNYVNNTAPGTFIYRGPFLKIMERLDNYFKNYALALGASEEQYPVTLPTASLVKNGYISGFPQNALFVASLMHKPESILMASTLPKDNFNTEGIDACTGSHNQVLSPTVCYHCFEALKNQTIKPDKIITAKNQCHRHESGNLAGLIRLQTYNMREIIYFGKSEFIGLIAEQIQNHCFESFKRWQIQCQLVSATDPFFSAGSEVKRIYQSIRSLKNELRMYIPYSKEWVSVASFNNHQASLTIIYNIKSSETPDLESGCSGYGYERMAYALYSQLGLNLKKWPKIIINDLMIEDEDNSD